MDGWTDGRTGDGRMDVLLVCPCIHGCVQKDGQTHILPHRHVYRWSDRGGQKYLNI